MNENGTRVLLIGVFGMELVECGGALLNNANNGGESHAIILFAAENMQREVKNAALHLQSCVEYADFKSHNIAVDEAHLLTLIRTIRRFKPDIIITQDPEHVVSDLDPGRRVAMTLILESIALASRDVFSEELPELEPHPIATVYYHTPVRPTCIVDIGDVWDEKCAAMDELKSQLEFSGKHYATYYGDTVMERVVPGWSAITDPLERGIRAKREMDKAYYLYQGATGHAHYAFSEAYRREGLYHFKSLMK